MTNTSVCEKTGKQSVNGSCPVHGGDACIVNVAVFRKLQRERNMLYILAKELARLSGISKQDIINKCNQGCAYACCLGYEIIEKE